MTPAGMRQPNSPNNRTANRDAAGMQPGSANRSIQSANQARGNGGQFNSRTSASARSSPGNIARGQQVNINNARANQQRDPQNARQLASVGGSRMVRGSIEGPSSFANPRHVAPLRAGMTPRVSANRPGKLSYRSGVSNTPRAGRVGVGRAGIIDPGGYIRTPHNGTAGIDRNYMRQQLSSQPNYNRDFNNNNRLRNSNYRSWPGGWNPGPYAGSLGYYPDYSWNGNNYPFSYFGLPGYSPTPWLFQLNTGAFWQPGIGYAETLPYGYTQPISIAVDEVVPSYDTYGNIMGYQDETFYYNATWDPNMQAYGYYDYRGVFHWTTFPWLHTWTG